MPRQKLVNSITWRFAVLLLAWLAVGQGPETIERSTQRTVKSHQIYNGEANEIRPGLSIERQIPGGTSHWYKITLEVGDHLRALLTKRDLDVSVTIFGPQGETCAEYVSRRYGPLYVSYPAETSGVHKVEIRSLENGPEDRQYQLGAEVKGATERERQYSLAMSAFLEAEKLCARWAENGFREAIEKYKYASRSWQSIHENREAAEALEHLGEAYFILSEYHHALEFHQKALLIRRASRDRLGEIASLNNIGYVYVYLGDNRRALHYLKKALDSHKQLRPANRDNEGLRKLAQVTNSLGEVYYSLSDFKNAKDSFNSALDLWTTVGDRRGQALAHLNVGYLHYDFGDLEEATREYNSALSFWHAVDDRRGEALAYTALGGVYSLHGEKQPALDSHNEALRLFRTIGCSQGEAATLNGIGAIYEGLNQPEIALDNYKRALELNQSIGNREFEVVAEIYIGRVYSSMRQLDQAIEYYDRSLRLVRQVGNRRLETHVLRYVAAVYASRGANQKALEQYHRALMLYGKFEDKRGQAGTLNSIGEIQYALGAQRKALKYYEQALSLYRTAEDRAGEISTVYNIARGERASGNIKEALSQINASISMVEDLRPRVMNSEFRASYFALFHKHYELYVDMLMQMHKEHPADGFMSEALYESERARARSLLELLVEAKVDLGQGADPDLVQREHTLLRLLNTKAEYQMRVLSGVHTKDDAAEIDREIRGITTQYKEVQAKIRQQSSLYTTVVQPRLLHLEQIQRELLDEDTILLEYALGEERSYLWVVSSTSIASFQLPARVVIEEVASNVYRQIIALQPLQGSAAAAQDQESGRTSESQFWQQASALSQMLLGPVLDRLSCKRLLIVSEGVLQHIPIESLPVPVSPECIGGETPTTIAYNDDRVPLGIEHEVICLPSASLLAALRREKRQSGLAHKTVAVLADPVFERDDPRVEPQAKLRADNAPQAPETARLRQALRDLGDPAEGSSIARLPSTLQEAREIKRLAPSGSNMMALGFDATLAKATSPELSEYQILHFATHGIINNDHPELSGIVLSLFNKEGDSQNGFLGLPDIYKLNLDAELVVVSTCRSGLGKTIRGEGMIGLTQGFMYAGSKSVLASLWRVSDEGTAELMKYFYSAMLKDGLPPAAALQKAKKTMWNQKRWHSPFFWAAFVLQGEYNTKIKVGEPSFTIAGKVAVASLILALSVGSLYAVKRMRTNRP